jgi:hypothetical protein
VLKILDPGTKLPKQCNGASRRGFLQVGALGLAGLSLPDLLRIEARAGQRRSHKSVIMIYLCGGPPHQDMYDLKLDAPVGIRGPFQPIQTNVPGVQICEKMPMIAGSMDRLVPIRSVVESDGGHTGYQCFTGRPRGKPQPAGGWTPLGSAASMLHGPVEPGVPPFVSLCYTTRHRPYNEPGPGLAGLAHSSFRPSGPGREDMILKGITNDRLSDRKQLLSSIDQFRRSVDTSGAMDGLDAFNQQAMGILTSSELAEALDLSREDPRLVERYGTGDPAVEKGDGAPRVPQNLLVARRLVEAGARVVTINYSFWDWHSRNFVRAEEELPIFDNAVSALVEDLHQRGMEKDVTVIAWGEFGRTPKINDNAGRDHWPRVSCALLAGGGMKTGQVIGSTDRLGGEAADRPVTFAQVMATLYHNLGIDVRTATVKDLNGRPQYLVDAGVEPISELV